MTHRVAGIGEILWDRFPDGDRLGGAPANFAFHAGQLGAAPHIISSIGQDADGERIAGLLGERGLGVEFLQRDAIHRTGIVRVQLNDGQPSYVIESPVAWDFIDLTEVLKNLASNLDAVCFGTLAQRNEVSRRAIQEFIRLCPGHVLRLFDINLRQNFYTLETIDFGLAHATAVKLNGEELVRLADLCGWPSSTNLAVAEIFKRYPVKWVVLTKGADGCEVRTREETIISEAPRARCVDAVGAGDAFSAAFVTGLLSGRPLREIADRANRVGAFVASQAGAMPLLSEEIKFL